MIDKNTINCIVNAVTSGEFKSFQQIINPSKLSSNFPKATERSDPPKKALETVITDFITNEFLKKPETVVKFINLVYSAYDNAIKEYERSKGYPAETIIFVYKGGNVLRYIAREYLNKLPGDAASALEKYYSQFFKKSDADFTIYINPDLPNFDEIKQDLTRISYLLLVAIRQIFLGDKKAYFDFYNLSEDEQKATLSAYLQKINESESIKNPEAEYYNSTFVALVLDNLCVKQTQSGGYKLIGFSSSKTEPVELPEKLPMTEQEQEPSKVDLLNIKPVPTKRINSDRDDMWITFEGASPDQFILHKLINLGANGCHLDKSNPVTSNFYISDNETLQFTTGDIFVSFILTRMKVNFKGVFVKEGVPMSMNLPGELIDVTINAKESHKVPEFYKDRNENTKMYVHTDSTGQSIQFRGASFLYLIHDLENILFNQTEFPWEDPKYVKRLNRLLYLYLIDILSDNNTLKVSQAANFLKELKTAINSSNMIAQLANLIRVSENEHLHIQRLMNELIRISSIAGSDSNYTEMISKLNENLDIMIKAVQDIEEFVESEGKVPSYSEVKVVELGQVGGKSRGKKNKN